VKYKHNFPLSEHLTLNELIHSDKADLLGIDNTPDLDSLYCLKALAVMSLEKVRVLFNAPLVPHCGYRCPAVNRAVDGKENSQHLKGQACDFHIDGHTIEETWQKIRDSEIPYDQLILETKNGVQWVHLSYDPDKTVQRHMAFKLNKT
jgi:zinc D-Ala-D-Ala carboxypeptidase